MYCFVSLEDVVNLKPSLTHITLEIFRVWRNQQIKIHRFVAKNAVTLPTTPFPPYCDPPPRDIKPRIRIFIWSLNEFSCACLVCVFCCKRPGKCRIQTCAPYIDNNYIKISVVHPDPLHLGGSGSTSWNHERDPEWIRIAH